jgi:hypothetical protein
MTTIYEQAEIRATEIRQQVLEEIHPYQRQGIELPTLGDLFQKLADDPQHLWFAFILQFDENLRGQIGKELSDDRIFEIMQSLCGQQLSMNPSQERIMASLQPINSFVIDHLHLDSTYDGDYAAVRMEKYLETYQTICEAILCYASRHSSEHSPLATYMGHHYPHCLDDPRLTEPINRKSYRGNRFAHGG